MENIETKRLVLRPFRETDYDDLYEFLAQQKDAEFEACPGLTYENCRKQLEQRLGSEDFLALELKETGKVIGNLYCADSEAFGKALELYIPRPEDLWFYQRMLSDPATMAYNAPWFPPDGCIPFPESAWVDWHEKWIGQEPERFYAYLRRRSDGAFVGGVDFHHTPERGWWDMGVVIYAPERGRGYGKQGLELLLDRAFRVAGIAKLHNEFETTRDAAYHIHKAVGFREVGIEDGILHLELTQEEYLRGK